MSEHTLKTRFAPSPTGYLHLGNARTALFSALLARNRGTFLLRIEDTDRERSREEFIAALEEDLLWLGLEWQEGPGREGVHGPYRQSQRAGLYDGYYQQLESAGLAYPCFCSPQELELSRKAQAAAGRPPRYSGKCARLSPEECEAKRAAGAAPTLRFRVPSGTSLEFDDLVRGTQRFDCGEIGDFIIRRADGSPAFFFCNAVDDALMGVTHVLRGEDHLTNTPRQILILEALGLPIPSYGHITMIVGHDGSPLSKRHGSRSLRDLRAEGYLPEAVANYLARLGHHYERDDFMSLDELAAGFEVGRLGRSPARYDPHQLLHWQHQAVARAEGGRLWAWAGEEVSRLVPEEERETFLDLVRANISFPHDLLRWVQVVYRDELPLDDEAREIMARAGRSFFEAALTAIGEHPTDFHAFSRAVRERSGAKGKELFMPLRVALTGATGGPELARLLPLLGLRRARARLAAGIE